LRGQGHVEEAIQLARKTLPIVEKHLAWNPDDARALHLGAGSLIITGDTERALRWLERAKEIDPNDPVVLYNIGCNLAVLGHIDRALDYLEEAMAQGTVSAVWMRNDEDLANLRDHPRFETLLLQSAGQTNRPTVT